MAQVHLILNDEELLQVLSGNHDDTVKMLVQKLLNEVIAVESDIQLGAERNERSESRTDYRNGTREKVLTTRIGTITLNVPRHRFEPFHSMVIENFNRSEAALVAAMAEMVVCGVSTRKISRITETLCGHSISKSSVSELCKTLDADIKAYMERPLEDSYPFLTVDATYFKSRDCGKVVSRAFMIAVGMTIDGNREVLGFGLYDDESRESWTDFLGKLKKRGVSSVSMITSDAHRSILHAAAKIYPDAAWQRCQFHFMRNILDETPKKYKAGLQTELSQMFNAGSAAEARKLMEEIAHDYRDVAERAVECLENGFGDSVTAMVLPKDYRRQLRTSNVIERMNGELKRRSNVVRVFPNDASVLRLMGAVAMEYAERFTVCHRRVYSPSIKEFTESTRLELTRLAHAQQALLDAA